MRRYGLIGRPLGHSRSAVYFAEKFQKEKISNVEYSLYELDTVDDLKGLLKRVPDLCGLNVTIPYKQQIIPLLDALSPEATAIGAVNCVRIREGRLTGYNTDVVGIRSTLQALYPAEQPAAALLLGTGGAAQAVRYVLTENGVRVANVSRQAGKTEYTYEMLTPEILSAYPLIVNTTPVGMAPCTDETPVLPYEVLTSGHTLFDLIYNPAETLFLQHGRAAGARTCNGEAMFCRQAEASWMIWNE